METFFGLGYYLTNDKLFILAIGWLIALAPFEKLSSSRGGFLKPSYLELGRRVFSIALLLLVTIELAGKTFNPFIYFRF